MVSLLLEHTLPCVAARLVRVFVRSAPASAPSSSSVSLRASRVAREVASLRTRPSLQQPPASDTCSSHLITTRSTSTQAQQLSNSTRKRGNAQTSKLTPKFARDIGRWMRPSSCRAANTFFSSTLSRSFALRRCVTCVPVIPRSTQGMTETYM